MPRGILLFARTRSAWGYGILPVAVSAGILFTLLVLLGFYLDDVARALTPFAESPSWPAFLRGAVRVSAAIAVLAAYVVGAAISFATLTNVVGQPFYEKLSDDLERRLGDPPPGIDAPIWRTLPRATAESILMIVLYVALIVPLFLLGFVPLLGQTVVAFVAFLVSGFFLAAEILAIPLERRGLHLRGRLRWLWERRAVTLGFGGAAFLLFLIPLMNVVAMPGAVFGATLLVRAQRDA